MSVTSEDIKKVSHLARIRVEEHEIDEIKNTLNGILTFVEQLKEVDCSKVDDSVQYITSLHEREDQLIDCDDSLMDNAPVKECNMFVVPKVVG